MKSTPKGGFGNRVLNYLNLRTIAHRLDVNYFSENAVDKKIVPGIHRRPPYPRLARPSRIVSREEVHRPEFFDSARELLSFGRVIQIKPRLLLDSLVLLSVSNPANFASISGKVCETHAHRPLAKAVMHLRGGDFAGWKRGSIHGADYYLSALEKLNSDEEGMFVRVCSDDQEHPAYGKVVQHLQSRKLFIEPSGCLNPFLCDLVSMRDAQYVVSSPSTFAIVAGLLGGARMIFSQQWVDSQTSEGEVFWTAVHQHQISGLDTWAFV